MKLMITGAEGFIGRAVVREALARRHQVVALHRKHSRGQSTPRPGVIRFECDLGSADSLNFSGMSVDAVIHLAASLSGSADEQLRSTVVGTEHLLSAMRRAGVRKLVGVSSLAVVDCASARPMSSIDEGVRVFGDERGMGTYAGVKARQESLFLAFAKEPGNHCVILRPGIVFDEARLVSAHAGVVKGPLRLLVTHEGEIPVVSLASVADAILDAIERPLPTGEVIHLVGDQLPNQAEYIAGLRRRGLLDPGGLNVSWRMIFVAAGVLNHVARLLGLGQRLPQALLPNALAMRMKPLRYSNAKAKNLLGWAPGKKFY
jgi:nucleoside-diphosphate-sugar epimerase